LARSASRSNIRGLPSTAELYNAPSPAVVAKLIAERGIDVALERWSESLTADSLRRLAMLVNGTPRDDADEIIETTRRLGEVKLAAKAMAISQTAIRTAFDRAGEKLPLSPCKSASSVR